MSDTNTYCKSCDSCDSCSYCDSCKSCKSCNYCDYCNYCYFCKNLKMTEHNYFCRSTEYNSDTSFQQKRYRVFNIEVTKEEYFNIKKIYHTLEFNEDEPYRTRFQTAFKKMRNGLTQEQKQEYYDITHFNREWFTYITEIEKEGETIEMTMEEINKALWKKIKIIE